MKRLPSKPDWCRERNDTFKENLTMVQFVISTYLQVKHPFLDLFAILRVVIASSTNPCYDIPRTSNCIIISIRPPRADSSLYTRLKSPCPDHSPIVSPPDSPNPEAGAEIPNAVNDADQDRQAGQREACRQTAFCQSSALSFCSHG